MQLNWSVGERVHTCNHNIHETKAEDFLVQGQTGLHSEPF